ncbi:hypothetical protein P8605_12930 [Streptomyces sp. T-3]|nr:hypothetical protein [Streptomyces sp. T-3]
MELPLPEIFGALYIPSSVAWLDPSIDLLLTSGAAIEVRSPDAQNIADMLAAAGIRTVPNGAAAR